MKYLTNNSLMHYINNGTLSFEDTMNSGEEKIMDTIISKVHHYKITKPKEGAKDKRWFTYVPDATKPNGRRRVCKNSQTELYKFLIEFYGVSEESNKGSLAFGVIFDDWVEYKKDFVKATNKKKSLSPSTINRYKRDYKKCFEGSKLDTTPIADITSILLEEEIKNAIVKYNLSESFAKNLIGYIENTFAFATRKRYIKTNEFLYVDKAIVLSFVTILPPKNDSERVLTKSEVNALYKAIRSHEERHPTYMPSYAIELALLTGMRVGEIAALHWSDIRDGEIHIDYSEHRLDYEDHSEIVIDEPKCLKHRTFPLNDAIEELLDRIRKIGMVGDFIFVREDGTRYTGHDISCACDRRASEAGIKKTSIHGIRRTVASELRKKFPIKMVSNLMGHLEETDEGYYNFDNSEFEEKKNATEHLCSNVLNFDEAKGNKKRAKAL